MQPEKILLVFVLSFALVCYVGSYIFLSEHGRYEPLLTSLHGIIYYGWAPAGFAQGGIVKEGKVIRDLKWHQNLMIAYFPLLFLDWKLWHQHIPPGEKTKYPIDKGIDSE